MIKLLLLAWFTLMPLALYAQISGPIGVQITNGSSSDFLFYTLDAKGLNILPCVFTVKSLNNIDAEIYIPPFTLGSPAQCILYVRSNGHDQIGTFSTEDWWLNLWSPIPK